MDDGGFARRETSQRDVAPDCGCDGESRCSAHSIPINICNLANFILGYEAVTGEDFEKAGLAIMGGCQQCGASIACYNAYPSKTGYWRG